MKGGVGTLSVSLSQVLQVVLVEVLVTRRAQQLLRQIPEDGGGPVDGQDDGEGDLNRSPATAPLPPSLPLRGVYQARQSVDKVIHHTWCAVKITSHK